MNSLGVSSRMEKASIPDSNAFSLSVITDKEKAFESGIEAFSILDDTPNEFMHKVKVYDT